MSDMKKTKALRVFLFVVIMSGVVVAAAAVDVLWALVTDHVFGFASRNLVEGTVFFLLVWSRVWDWLDRRVWIGTNGNVQ